MRLFALAHPQAYLDIDLPAQWATADKMSRVADAVVNGEWDGDAPRTLVSDGAASDAPRQVIGEELLMRTLECAVQR